MLLKETDPKRFEELFGKGIPCIVREVSGPRDVARFKVDHGNELSLTDPFELYKCVKMLFDAGFTEIEAVVEVAGMMERISPMKPERRREIEALATPKEREKALAEYRRGFIQGLHNIARSPLIVEAALEYKASGEPVEGFEDQYLPKLTISQVGSLWKAHSEDLKVQREDGTPVFSKRSPGPKFREKWEKIVEISKKREADQDEGVVRDKAMSGKDMKAELKDGKWLSKFGHLVTKHHAGDKSVGDLSQYDYTCYMAELVKEADPKLWKQVEKSAKAIEAEVNKKLAEAEVKVG